MSVHADNEAAAPAADFVQPGGDRIYEIGVDLIIPQGVSNASSWWGNPIYVFKDYKQRALRGEKDAFCVKCKKHLRYCSAPVSRAFLMNFPV